MRLSSLGSGSRGNATLVEVDGQTLMIDCGFGLKETASRLAIVDRNPAQIDAILVTHEHGDHISGVEAVAAKFDIPVYMSRGTFSSWKSRGRVEPILIIPDQRFAIGSIEILPVAVPHDAREPVQFVFESSGRKIGVLTDLGSITPHLVQAYTDCHALLVEANHDLQMLANGQYPASLKKRVSGAWGHLNNSQTVELINRVNMNQQLQHLIIGHISQQNNSLELAKSALGDTVRSLKNVVYAAQDEPMSWIDVS